MAKIPNDIAEWRATLMAEVQSKADAYTQQGIDVSSCTAAFLQQVDKLGLDVAFQAETEVHDLYQEAVEIMSSDDGDSIIAQLLAVQARARAESAKPGREYGKHVNDILEDLATLARTADWNRFMISYKLASLENATDVVTHAYPVIFKAVYAIQDDVASCMRRKLH